jgi:hypothetical protein
MKTIAIIPARMNAPGSYGNLEARFMAYVEERLK